MRAEPSILPLRLENVGFDAGGRTLLHSVDLEFSGLGRTMVLGPNGAGKSLLLRLCHGLLTPTRGRVAWLGPGAGMKIGGRLRRRHAMVFQRPVMLRRSALDNIEHAVSIAGCGRRAHAMTALDRFGLADLGPRPARLLSGGEQQRLALARAWALRPEVLFLDEPTANLDVAAVKAVEEMLARFTEDGIKVVMTTHDLGQARRLADEVIFVHHGRVLETGPAAQFFAGPATPQATGFLKGELIA
jgi:tungstate transport system ATP-binding protein